MSYFPKPASFSTEPRKKPAYESEAHGELLEWAYDNAVQLVGAKSPAAFDASKVAADMREKIEKRIARIDEVSKGAAAQPYLAGLQEARAQLLATLEEGAFPAWDAKLASPSLASRQIALPVSEAKAGRYGYADPKVVGYVDLAVTMKVPASLSLGSPFLDRFPCQRKDDALREIVDLTKVDVSDLAWEVLDASVTTWIDVRPALPPVGQLVRELKVMQAYAGFDVEIYVVTETASGIVREVLASEGFGLVERQAAMKAQ